jgi:fucose permease
MSPLNMLRSLKGNSKIGLILMAYIAFIALGMQEGLLGIAWPTMRVDFSIPLDSIGILLVASVIGYMTSSFMSGALVTRMGIGRLLLVSFALAGAAFIGYALAPSWWMLIIMSVFAGLGAGAIDAGLNTYVAANFGEGSMQWLHASFGVGATFGPIIMTAALTAFNSWRPGYGVVGSVRIALAMCFVFTLPMWSRKTTLSEANEPKTITDYKTPMGQTLQQPSVWLSALMFFTYVGAEISLGTWIYSLLVEARGVDPTMAGIWTGSFWATFTLGRVLAGLYARRIGVHRLVQGCLVIALVGTILLVWNPSSLANLLAVVLIGFSIAPIFPAMMSGTSRRVGESSAVNTIGIQMTATGLGTAVIPGLLGILARNYSLEIIPICLVVVFLAVFISYRLSMALQTHQERLYEHSDISR